MWTKQFLLDAAERAAKTFAQSLLGVLTVHTMGASLYTELLTAGVAAGTSLLSSFGVGGNGSASLVPSVRNGPATGRHESA